MSAFHTLHTNAGSTFGTVHMNWGIGDTLRLVMVQCFCTHG